MGDKRSSQWGGIEKKNTRRKCRLYKTQEKLKILHFSKSVYYLHMLSAAIYYTLDKNSQSKERVSDNVII